jgi:hypothetical protein
MSAEDMQKFASDMLSNNNPGGNDQDALQPPTHAADKTRKGEKFDILRVDY